MTATDILGCSSTLVKIKIVLHSQLCLTMIGKKMLGSTTLIVNDIGSNGCDGSLVARHNVPV